MNPFQEVFDKQKAYFDSDATKSYEWRIDQLNRLEHLCNENSQALEDAMSSDFKTASQEKVFEIMAPVGTVAFAKAELRQWMKPVDVVVLRELTKSIKENHIFSYQSATRIKIMVRRHLS